MKAFTICHRNDDLSKKLSLNLEEHLMKLNFKRDDKNPDIIISVGGDGTFLRSIHQYLDISDKVNFIGMHTGTLGFYTDYTEKQLELLIDDIKNDKVFQICEMPLLEIDLIFASGKKTVYALNEIRIENNLSTLILDVEVDKLFLEKYRGNGLIVCSPTGSTAYNYSLGGAIIDHKAMVMQLTEVAAIHHNKYRSLGASLVLDKERVIKFKTAEFNNAVIGIDYFILEDKNIQEVQVRLSKKHIRVVRYRPKLFINRIRNAFIVE